MQTVKCVWVRLNEIVDMATGEVIRVSPKSYLCEEIQKNLPCEAFVNLESTTKEVYVNGRFKETITMNVIVSYMFIDKDIFLEHNSSL